MNRSFAGSLLGLLSLTFNVLAAPSSPPEITVLATDASAAEDGPDPATFQISRSGGTNEQLTVLYSLGGSARNGRDYTMLPGRVTIPIGSFSASVPVTPIRENAATGETNETVILQVQPWLDIRRGKPLPYVLGWPSNALATISESTVPPTNRWPSVRLLSPKEGAGFIAPANLELVAEASDADGTVKTVEFIAATSTETNSLGIVTNRLNGERFRNLFTLDVSLPAGKYTLAAKATDDEGGTATSQARQISILAREEIPVITVAATDPNASELGPDPGTFTLSRTGDTSGALAVYYTLGGTARNGLDYERLPGITSFRAGQVTAQVEVSPIPRLDSLTETNDTVILQLQPLRDVRANLLGLYAVGSPSNAVVNIAADTNAFPVVTVTATDSQAAEDGPNTGTFQFVRSGNTNRAVTVYYSLGGTARNGRDYQMLPGYVTFAPGTVETNVTILPIAGVDRRSETNETVVLQLRPRFDLLRPLSEGYVVGWPSNAVVNIAESAIPMTNELPVVQLISPKDGAGYVAPATIRLFAQAKDSDGRISNVEFIAATRTSTNSLGVVSNSVPKGQYRGLYSLVWSNAAVGNYQVFARAADNQGGSTTSDPLHIIVTATALPTVNLSAADPIAFISPVETNKASFLVRRTGATNDDLVVYYTTSGKTSNGVDFVKLPGSVTLPAGQSSASIVIDPLPSLESKGARVRMVKLILLPAPFTDANPPAYLVGRFDEASAIILERGPRVRTTGPLAEDVFEVVLPAAAATSTYRVEASTNLVDWEVVGSCDATEHGVQFLDPNVAGSTARFYRARPEPEE